MDWSESSHNLHFEHRGRPPNWRLVAIVAMVVGFALLWLIVPRGVLFWLLLLLVVLLVWLATYGWRKALQILIEVLSRLEDL